MVAVATQSASLRGTSLAQPQRVTQQRVGRMVPAAIFGRKAAVVEEAPPPPPKRGLFSFGASTTKQQPASKKQQQQSSKALDKADEYK